MALNDTTTGSDVDVLSRERAIKRLKKRRDFYGHLVVYAVVNSFLVAIWAVTDLHGFFWPIFPMLGWGIGVVLNAWDVYRNDAFSEEQIQREVEHLRRS
jgi:2TM domain